MKTLSDPVGRRGDPILKRLPSGKVTVAEIGVFKGNLSTYLLTSNQDLTLYMVDPWGVGPRGPKREPAPEHLENLYKFVEAKTRFAEKRRIILRGWSPRVSKHIPDRSLDLCFIDADHTAQACRKDIFAWWPKVKLGGWLAGHDYMRPGVNQAVDRYVIETGAKVEVDSAGTWFSRVIDPREDGCTLFGMHSRHTWLEVSIVEEILTTTNPKLVACLINDPIAQYVAGWAKINQRPYTDDTKAINLGEALVYCSSDTFETALSNTPPNSHVAVFDWGTKIDPHKYNEAWSMQNNLEPLIEEENRRGARIMLWKKL